MAHDTLAKMFWDRVSSSADKPAQQWKRGGAWQTATWRQVGDAVREVAAGLIGLGRKRGEAVAILAGSRPEWVQADFAIFSIGGVTIPIYPTYPPDLVQYIVNDAGVKTLIVEDPAQLAKVLELRAKMDGLEQIVVVDGTDTGEPGGRVLTWAALREQGRKALATVRDELDRRIAEGKPDE